MGGMPSPEQEAAQPASPSPEQAETRTPKAPAKPMPREIDGPAGPEPTRYGDWERKGRVSDF